MKLATKRAVRAEIKNAADCLRAAMACIRSDNDQEAKLNLDIASAAALIAANAVRDNYHPSEG